MSSYATSDSERSIHLWELRLIYKFGDRDDLWRAIGSDVATYGWVGGAATYIRKLKGPIERLVNQGSLQKVWLGG